jgi:hypothetical protein
MGDMPARLRLRTKVTNRFCVSHQRTATWGRFVEAVYEAVAAEACCYHDCTPVMAALRAAESPHYPMAAGRMDWGDRLTDTCRALNELLEAGRVEMRAARCGPKRRAYRPAGE